MPFIDKLNYLLAQLEQGEIDESEAYRIFTAHGEPKPRPTAPQQGAIIDFLDD